MNALYLPAVSNSPLLTPSETHAMGRMELRRNEPLQFIENAAFEAGVAAYDFKYQNSQAHSHSFIDHMKQVAQVIGNALPKGGFVVEVGCGKGDFITLLEADTKLQVRGFDATYDGNSSKIAKRYLT